MKYVCLNEECSKFNVVQEFSKTTHKYDKQGNLFCVQSVCSCGKSMEDVTQRAPLSEKELSISKFSIMTPEQKKAALKQRSSDHYKKEIRDRRHGLLDKAIQEMKNL